MKLAHSLLALPLLALSVPSMAEDPAPAQGDTTTNAPQDKGADRMICRTQEEIGSRLRKRKICMTAAQWRETSFQAGQKIDKRTAEMPKPGG